MLLPVQKFFPQRIKARSSGTFFMISPCLIRSPTPTPPAIPISASFASPGPFTTQPITATLISWRDTPAPWFLPYLQDRSDRSVCVQQVGHDTTSMPPLRSPRVFRIRFADLISSKGAPVRETRMVSPIP